jgi:hypothetical protein
VFSLWDTFRAAHPLYTIIERARTLDFIQTFLAMYKESGRLPVWELWGNETDCMIGYHAVSVITDAYVKGIGGFDEQLALEAMLAMANSDRFGLPAYRKYGYIPADMESESVSKTLEYAYDDACITIFAGQVGSFSTGAQFRQRSRAWLHLVNADGFMQPRVNGRWLEPFDPREVTFHFTEANAWQYRFFVPADMNLLGSTILGGPDRLEQALDEMFSADSRTTGREQVDITGLIGQYAHGNEPSHHVAYLYMYTKSPHKTQAMVRRIMEEMYSAAPDGLVGNEDCGQMSAWYVLSALGLYPVAPGAAAYDFGSPLFEWATVHLENGEEFVVQAHGNSAGAPYVQAIKADGRWPGVSRFSHPLRGGELLFEMGSSPPTRWRVEPELPMVPAAAIPMRAPFVDGPTVFTDSVRVRLHALDPGAVIHYTLDGSKPTWESSRYERPFTLTASGLVRFLAIPAGAAGASHRPVSGHVAAMAEVERQSPIVDATFRKIDPRVKITERNPLHRQYQAGGPVALIDGVRGGTDFRLGTWQGIYGVDLDADVDLGETRAIHRIATGFLHDQNSWIFFPLEVIYSVSDDRETWTEVGRATSNLDPRHDGAVIEDFAVKLATPVRARYVRVLGKSPIKCPDWHKGAGNQAFIFADEIIVK